MHEAIAKPSRRAAFALFGAIPAFAISPMGAAPGAEDAELLALGARVEAIRLAREAAVAAMAAAFARFKATAPELPDELVLHRVDDRPYEYYVKGPPGVAGTGRVISAELMRPDLARYGPRTLHGEWMRKTLRIAEDYNQAVAAAWAASGHDAACARLEEVERELEQAVSAIFAIAPRGVAGVAAQARALLACADLDGARGERALAGFAPALARNLVGLAHRHRLDGRMA